MITTRTARLALVIACLGAACGDSGDDTAVSESEPADTGASPADDSDLDETTGDSDEQAPDSTHVPERAPAETEGTEPADAAAEPVATTSGDAEPPDAESGSASSDDVSPYRRIVVSDQALLDGALALDLPVAGIPGFTDRETIPAYLAEFAVDVEVLGDRTEQNLEQLAAFGPDLLLFNTKSLEALGADDALEQIAEVADVDVTTATPWRQSLRLIAEAGGVPDRADARIAAADAAIDDAATSLSDDQKALEISVVRCFNGQCRYLPGGTSFSGQVLDEVGVARPAIQASDPEGRAFVNVSPEQYDLLGGDVIVLFGTDAEAELAQLRDNPLWNTLEAVQAGRVVEVDATPWFTGNVLAVEFIVADVVRILNSL
ncbi:MAG: ABC transporter substrate-binding protein [Actinomycetota bacterium]